MRRFVLTSIVFLLVFVYNSATHAYTYMYVIDGTMESIVPSFDPRDWDGEHWELSISIDSEASEVPWTYPSPEPEPHSTYDGIQYQFTCANETYSGVGGYISMSADHIGYDTFGAGLEGVSGLPWMSAFVGFPLGTFIHDDDTVYPIQDLSFDKVEWGDLGLGTGPPIYQGTVESFESRAVPEPTTMLLFGAGLVGLAGFGRKKFKK